MINILHQAIHEELRQLGFARKSSTWYSGRDDCILVVNLQRSMWSKQYYINLGVWFKPLGRKKTPKEYECHIRRRLSGVKLEQALDLEDATLSDADRRNRVVRAIRQRGLSFLNKCAKKTGVKRMLKIGKLDYDHVDVKVWRLVGVKPPF